MNDLVLPASATAVPKVTGIEPCGSQILIEVLTAKELIGTTIEIGDTKADGPPQAYIRKLGPLANLQEWGFAVGDRIIVSGKYTPVPECENSSRALGLVEPHMIKAVLTEQK